MSSQKRRHAARYAIVGAIAFAATQSLLFGLSAGSATTASDAGWFLNSGTGVMAVTAVLAAASAIVAIATPQSSLWRGALAFAAGSTAAMSAALFAIGPGTIFPLVILFGGALITAAAFAGGSIGVALRSLARRQPSTRTP